MKLNIIEDSVAVKLKKYLIYFALIKEKKKNNMKTLLKLTLAISAVVLILLIIVLVRSMYLFNFTKEQKTTVTLATTTATVAEPLAAASDLPAKIANPASTNCLEKGGRLVIEKRGDGGEYGLCYFEDNRACEEWALLNGLCPLGGVKTTGFDTIEQKYCAWSGGETFAEPNAICTFKNGRKCPVEEYYRGTCSFSS